MNINSSRKTEKRCRLNSFCIVKFSKFVLHLDFSAAGHIRWRHCHIRSTYSKICIWQWSHRTWPKAGKIIMQQKFAEFHNTKRIRSISLLSFSWRIYLHLKKFTLKSNSKKWNILGMNFFMIFLIHGFWIVKTCENNICIVISLDVWILSNSGFPS